MPCTPCPPASSASPATTRPRITRGWRDAATDAGSRCSAASSSSACSSARPGTWPGRTSTGPNRGCASACPIPACPASPVRSRRPRRRRSCRRWTAGRCWRRWHARWRWPGSRCRPATMARRSCIDQIVRGSIVLPHGIGKSLRVVVFAKGDKVDEAKAAGADEVGGAGAGREDQGRLDRFRRVHRRAGHDGRRRSAGQGARARAA